MTLAPANLACDPDADKGDTMSTTPVDYAAMLTIVHLREQLTKANARAEHFERYWCLERGELDKAEARVATLEAECVAWRAAEDTGLIAVRCDGSGCVSGADSDAMEPLVKARAATGPIGGVA
jgi:hypothetical protein